MLHGVDKDKSRPIQIENIKINRGILDALSPLWFCLALNSLSNLLNKTKYGYSIGKPAANLSHLLCMDDIKLYAKTKREMDYLIKITYEFSKDIRMSFGLDKCRTVTINQ